MSANISSINNNMYINAGSVRDRTFVFTVNAEMFATTHKHIFCFRNRFPSEPTLAGSPIIASMTHESPAMSNRLPAIKTG